MTFADRGLQTLRVAAAKTVLVSCMPHLFLSKRVDMKGSRKDVLSTNVHGVQTCSIEGL